MSAIVAIFICVDFFHLVFHNLCFRYMHISPERFDHLLSLVSPIISKASTNYREPISAGACLAITVRFLASDESQQSLSLSYRMGKSTVSYIIRETCDAIYSVLSPMHLQPPTSQEHWLTLSNQFEEQWDLPHIIGALDGKHIRIQCPPGTGTLFHNYKGFFSMVLLALCDANYCFTLIHIGHYGSNNDSGILAQSEMGNRFESESINLPSPSHLEGYSFDPLPYFIIGDEIFPLKTWLMRPYPGKSIEGEQSVYNYRHSRASRVIENAFGILASRWRIFNTPIIATVENIQSYVKAAIVLHNYLRQTENAIYSPTGDSSGKIKPGHWREILTENKNALLQKLTPVRGSRYKGTAVDMRNALKDYVNSEIGSLSWQLDYVRRT